MSKIVEVKNLTKVYQLYNRPIDRLKEGISLTRKNYHRDFYALNDISFDVEKGESFGIIGVNGSGKSTLLKILTGVLSKTSGDVKVDGKVAALLELGAGFNLDYTGIENIYLNGTMMGFSKEEMDAKLDKIIEFADLKDNAIYRPVKEYSSGMFVRLAFSLSIAVEPEILIVDEALSVGDIFFQTKCYKRMDELKNKGTTIIMVTHDLGAVIKYCDRTMVLHNGNQVAIGTPHEMVDLYKKILAGQEVSVTDFTPENIANRMKIALGHDNNNEQNGDAEQSLNTVGASSTSPRPIRADIIRPLKDSMSINPHADIYGDMKAEFIDFGILDQKGNPATVIVKGETFTIKERIRMNEDIKDPIFTWTLKDKRGTDLTGTNTMLEKVDTGFGEKGRVYDVSFTQKMRLQGGEYLLSMSCTSFDGDELKVHHRMYDVISLTVLINENKVGIFDSESKVEIH